MCGIFAVIGSKLSRAEIEDMVRAGTAKIRHRGPDQTGIFVSEDGWCGLGFARLAIVDPVGGAQPMYNDAKSVYSVSNAEIYNHKEIRAELGGKQLHSHSDCEVVIPTYEKHAVSMAPYAIEHMFNSFKGVFASVTVDLSRGQFIAARDPIGVRAMFYGKSDDGAVFFSSEAKAILDYCSHVEPFLPGCFYASTRDNEQSASFTQYYKPLFYQPGWLPTQRVDLKKLHDSFVTACTRRLMSDVPIGVFISGGLDSSLVASVAKKHLSPDYEFHSFSCGLEGSPDLAAAQKVADYLGTTHHPLVFTVEEGIAALEKLIYHLETSDITTIRASTPHLLLSGLVKKYCKVVLSGEGADELHGGYLYFHNAPSEQAFYEETVRRVKLLYTSDVLRGDRSTAAESLEIRVPFLDRDFMDVSMGFSAKDKMTSGGKRIEKWAMRQAFTKESSGIEYLPEDILQRPKEQFSDGVGYNWIDSLKAHCEANVTDEELATAGSTFPHDPPTTKEGYFYRKIFEKIFGKYKATQGLRKSIVKWVPLWSDSDDPSGRAQKFHAAAYTKAEADGGESIA